MNPIEREKLFAREKSTLSIGITEEGETCGKYDVPWHSTHLAYNMKLPNVYLSKDDLSNEALMEKICKFTVIGCYVFCPLENYDFINRFPALKDLTIHEAHNLKELSFLKSIQSLRLLYLAKAHLKHINEVIGPEPFFMAKPPCVALHDCIIDDVSMLHEKKVLFSELVVMFSKKRDERERWQGIRNFHYFYSHLS